MSEFMFPRLFAGTGPKTVSRLYMGLYINSERTTLEGVILRQTGDCMSDRYEVLSVQSSPLPAELISQYRFCQDSIHTSGGGVEGVRYFGDALVKLRFEASKLLIQTAQQLLESNHLSSADITAAGILDPGLWFNLDGQNQYMECFDSVEFASRTGINTCSSFPRSDIAVNGLGGSITAVPFWILLRSEQKNRVVLELNNDAIRISYLAPVFRGGLKSVLSFDASPGLALLNHMVRRLSGNNQHCDQGGQLAVQGRKIPQLLSWWNDNPFFQKPVELLNIDLVPF